jgi:uncharacterized protein YbjT (DUF2867 family)
MIAVTGANGALGSAAVEHLLNRLPANQLAVSVRDPEKARRFADRGVRVRAASYDDPAALRESLEGAKQVLLVSQNSPSEDGLSLHRNVIEAAVAVGAERVLYTSHQNVRGDSPFAPAHEHAATEEVLAQSGIAWTALRTGFYAHSTERLLGPWRETGRISAPADGPVAWTDRAELGEAAALVLAGGGFDGPVTLTARRAVTFAEIAAGLGVEHVVMDDEEWVADRIATGTPAPLARMLAFFFQAARRGHFADDGPTLAGLLGREPRTVVETLTA